MEELRPAHPLGLFFTQVDANMTITRPARTVFKRTISACCSVTVLLASTATMAAGPYEPLWESLDKRPMPGWFNEAKFGVFICWGPYSVPSWAPNRHVCRMVRHEIAQKGSPTHQFHLKNYGADFKYEQFGPMLQGELWDPDSWAGLVRDPRQVCRLDRELPRRLLQLAQPVPQRLEQRGRRARNATCWVNLPPPCGSGT